MGLFSLDFFLIQPRTICIQLIFDDLSLRFVELVIKMKLVEQARSFRKDPSLRMRANKKVGAIIGRSCCRPTTDRALDPGARPCAWSAEKTI